MENAWLVRTCTGVNGYVTTFEAESYELAAEFWLAGWLALFTSYNSSTDAQSVLHFQP
ncbi:hypothetical protein GQ54DRAFT_300605 [Martensiomyces pterosporus]|nr:hypothetical protein GQ54DRAFT_300605 [Martensiomyces pterosporus]